jgi:hypothetical protein
MMCYEEPLQYLPRDIEENHDKVQSGQPHSILRPKIKKLHVIITTVNWDYMHKKLFSYYTL